MVRVLKVAQGEARKEAKGEGEKNPLSDAVIAQRREDTATDLLGDDVDGLEPADLAVNIGGFSLP